MGRGERCAEEESLAITTGLGGRHGTQKAEG